MPHLLTALLLGLVSSFHCLGMCGAIIGSLSLNLEPRVRCKRWLLGIYVLAYNLGRISSYTVAGAIAGGVGYVVQLPFEPVGYRMLQLLASLIIASAGLHLTGRFPRFVYIERLGARIWRHLEPWGSRFLPVRDLRQAFLFGAVWGWLPCSLVYSTLALAATTGSPLGGALTMLFFGVGTLPALFGVGIMMKWLVFFARDRFRLLAGGVLLVLALFSAFPKLLQELLAWLWGAWPWWESWLERWSS